MAQTSKDILHSNIEWHIELIAIQINHAKKVKGRAKSGYYKLATILGASIVECVVHALLVNRLGNSGVIYTGGKIAYECQQLPKNFNDKHELAICKRKPETLELKKNPDFAVLNNACLKEEIFSKRIFNKVDVIRKNRNKIHLQGLKHIDRSYTIADIEKVSATISVLLDLYNKSKPKVNS